MKWQGCKPLPFVRSIERNVDNTIQMTYFFIDFSKAASAFFAFSSAVFSFSAAAFSLSSAAFIAFSARTDVSSAFTLAASAAVLAACASRNARSAFASICFCCACTFSRSPVVAQPIIRVGRTSIIVIRNRLFFISLHLLYVPFSLSGRWFASVHNISPGQKKRGLLFIFDRFNYNTVYFQIYFQAFRCLSGFAAIVERAGDNTVVIALIEHSCRDLWPLVINDGGNPLSFNLVRHIGSQYIPCVQFQRRYFRFAVQSLRVLDFYRFHGLFFTSLT